ASAPSRAAGLADLRAHSSSHVRSFVLADRPGRRLPHPSGCTAGTKGEPMSRSSRIAIDVGGTFTDVVELLPDTGELRFDKVPTTPSAPTAGVLNAFGVTESELADVTMFTHGTTLGLNALLTRTGARTAVIGTQG